MVDEGFFSVLAVCTAAIGGSTQAAVAPGAAYLLSMMTARTLLFSVSFCCGYIIRSQLQRKRRGSIWGVLVFIPLYTIVATGALIRSAMESGMLSTWVIALSGGLLCTNVILCVLVNKLEESRFAEAEKQKLQKEAAHNLEVARTYQKSFDRQRKITHEFRNQLDAIENLLNQREYDRAADYIRQLQHHVHEVVPAIHTNHPMVDAVLNQKYHEASDKGVGMLLSCNDLSEIPMDDSDLVTLLGNLLDNAISASEQTEEKQIWLRLWQEQGIYQLTVRNSCRTEPVLREPQQEMLHGYGTGLVQAVLEKYGYLCYAERTGGVFAFTAILG